MTKSKTKHPRLSKKQIILLFIAGVIVALVGLWGWSQIAPRPLGDQLEYLGKEDYGNILGFDYRPSSIYYYGTDLSPEELGLYFKKAAYAPKDNFAFEHARFIGPNKKIFIFTYKNDSPFTTEKKYIISLPSSQYPYAKNSL